MCRDLRLLHPLSVLFNRLPRLCYPKQDFALISQQPLTRPVPHSELDRHRRPAHISSNYRSSLLSLPARGYRITRHQKNYRAIGTYICIHLMVKIDCFNWFRITPHALCSVTCGSHRLHGSGVENDLVGTRYDAQPCETQPLPYVPGPICA
jgi:hypothetical protein